MSKRPHSRFDCNPGCIIEAALSLIDGKWKGVILYHLLKGPVRFNELRRSIPCLSQRMLTAQLRQLEADGLILRKVFPQMPPKVEYSMSSLGLSFEPILDALGAWGEEHKALFRKAASSGIQNDERDWKGTQ